VTAPALSRAHNIELKMSTIKHSSGGDVSAEPTPGPFGDTALLQHARDLCAAIERLPAGEHASKMSSLAGDLAFGLQQLQATGDHFWPRAVPASKPMPTISILLAAIHSSLDLDSPEEIRDNIYLIDRVLKMTSAERDTITAAFKKGPLDSGDVPSKSARDTLVLEHFVARVVVRGEDGFNACTHKGRAAYNILQVLEA
jgi:hypothetical protein